MYKFLARVVDVRPYNLREMLLAFQHIAAELP